MYGILYVDSPSTSFHHKHRSSRWAKPIFLHYIILLLYCIVYLLYYSDSEQCIDEKINWLCGKVDSIDFQFFFPFWFISNYWALIIKYCMQSSILLYFISLSICISTLPHNTTLSDWKKNAHSFFLII